MKPIHTVPEKNAHLTKTSIFLYIYIFFYTKKVIFRVQTCMCPPSFNELIPEHVYATQGSTQVHVGDLYARKSLNYVAL